MELKNLRTFRSVADHLNFTTAARELFLAQSSVSAQIKSLEEELDTRLFDRIGRKVLLTAAGQKLYDYAKKMEDMTIEIKSEIGDSKYVKGTLTIRVPESLACVYMPLIVEQFHKKNPRATLIFINCTDRQLKEELNTGRIDLAFLMTDAIHFTGVTVRMMKTEDLVLVAGKANPLAQMGTIGLKDLDRQTVLLAKTD